MKTVFRYLIQNLINLVYILPLRNENSSSNLKKFFKPFVYILPLRNENVVFRWTSCGIPPVYILPLRNENTGKALKRDGMFCLYPTFKEWKLILFISYVICKYCLYPTFKEWKRSFQTDLHDFILCLYPTFKEWKPRLTWTISFFKCSFISYL